MARVREASPVDPPVKYTASTLPAATPASQPRRLPRGVNDPRSFFARGFDELLFVESDAQAGLDRVDLDQRVAPSRNRNLCPFRTRGERMTEPPVHHLHQPVMMNRVPIQMAHEPKLGLPLRRVERVDQMPRRQIEIGAIRYFTSFRVQAAVTGLSQNGSQFDPPVDIRSRDMHAVMREHVFLAIHPRHSLRTHPHQ